MFDWLPWRRAAPKVDDALWRDAVAVCPLAQRLGGDDRGQLRALVERFLQRKRFHAIEAELDARQRVLIAMQACVPVLHIGFSALRGWQSVIVYPGPFRVRHRHYDGSTGVVTDSDEVRAGEAWSMGPLVLSWTTVEQGLLHPWDGFNVVVHEIAHKLDMLDGPPDGVPPLPRGLSRPAWIGAFQQAYDRLVATIGHEPKPLIDSYAATHPSEYFAVVSELHFSNPGRLRRAEPAIADLLQAYYGPSPAPISAEDPWHAEG